MLFFIELLKSVGGGGVTIHAASKEGFSPPLRSLRTVYIKTASSQAPNGSLVHICTYIQKTKLYKRSIGQ